MNGSRGAAKIAPEKNPEKASTLKREVLDIK